MPSLRILLSLVLVILPAAAQRSDTIFAAPLSNVTSAPVYSAPIRNIGQSGHLIWVQLFNNPVCNAPATVDIGLEASFNGTAWSPVGTTITTVPLDINNNLIASATAQGSFPYVRAAVRSLASGCRADIRYSGTVGGQGTVSIEGGAGGGVIFPKYIQPPPSVTQVSYLNSPAPCYNLLNVSNERGRLSKVDMIIDWVDGGMLSGQSLFLEYNVDGAGYIPLLTLITGVLYYYQLPKWSIPIYISTGYSDVTIGHRFSYNTLVDYSQSLIVRICPNPNPTPNLFNVQATFAIYRNVRVD